MTGLYPSEYAVFNNVSTDTAIHPDHYPGTPFWGLSLKAACGVAGCAHWFTTPKCAKHEIPPYIFRSASPSAGVEFAHPTGATVPHPSVPRAEAKYGTNYQDFALYSISGDPAKMVNLVGREKYRDVAATLRKELERRIMLAGEPETSITAIHYDA